MKGGEEELQEIMAQMLKPANQANQGNAYGTFKTKGTNQGNHFGDIMRSVNRKTQEASKAASRDSLNNVKDQIREGKEQTVKEIHVIKSQVQQGEDNTNSTPGINVDTMSEESHAEVQLINENQDETLTDLSPDYSDAVMLAMTAGITQASAEPMPAIEQADTEISTALLIPPINTTAELMSTEGVNTVSSNSLQTAAAKTAAGETTAVETTGAPINVPLIKNAEIADNETLSMGTTIVSIQSAQEQPALVISTQVENAKISEPEVQELLVSANQASASPNAVTASDESEIISNANIAKVSAAASDGSMQTKTETDSDTGSQKESTSDKSAKSARSDKVEVAVHTKSQGKAEPKTVFVDQNAVKTESESDTVNKNKTNNLKELISMETDKFRGVQPKESAINPDKQTIEAVVRNDVNLETPKTEINIPIKNQVISAKVDTQNIIEQIVQKFELVSKENSSSVTIQLKPEFLGKLHISLTISDGVLTAKFHTDNQQVRHMLEGGIGQLRSALETTGIRLEKAEVNVDLSNSGSFQGFNQPEYQNPNKQPSARTYWIEQTAAPEAEYETVSAQYADIGKSTNGVNYVI